jgi:hypothetical protein
MDLGKLILFGGAGYLAYLWYNQQPASSPATTSTTDAAAAAAATAAATAAAKATADAKAAADQKALIDAAVAATVANTDERILEKLAADPALAKGTKGSALNRLKWDQWNWYLAKWDSPQSTARTGPIPNPLHVMYGIEDVGLTNRDQLLSAEEYHDLKHAKGFEGFRGFGRRGMGNLFLMRNAWPENHRTVTDRNVV